MQDDLRKIILCRDVLQGIKQCIGFINEYCHAMKRGSIKLSLFRDCITDI